MAAQPNGAIPKRIEQLLQQRQIHLDALDQIDQTLQQIAGLLQVPGRRGRRGRPAGSTAAASTRAGRPRGRRRRKVTAEQFVHNFVEQQGSPTTGEIKAAWRSNGRKGTPDNTLSKMVREKKLKRQPLPGERGSRYSVAR